MQSTFVRTNRMTLPPPTADFSWHDGFLLGYTPMDETHEEFVCLVGAMKAAPDVALGPLLDQFARHAKEHFETEDAWMVQTQFPARDCHIAEHAAVRNSVETVRKRLADGDLAEGDLAEARRLVAHLESWFPGHADYLDSALAHWMCKLRWGGKPIVMRRNVVAPRVVVDPDQ